MLESVVAQLRLDVGDEKLIALVCTAFVGGCTLLLALRYLLHGILGRMSSISVRGKHCLVTGGSSGIGKEVAKVCRYTCFSYSRSICSWRPCVASRYTAAESTTDNNSQYGTLLFNHVFYCCVFAFFDMDMMDHLGVVEQRPTPLLVVHNIALIAHCSLHLRPDTDDAYTEVVQ